jgi:hypothetical protein
VPVAPSDAFQGKGGEGRPAALLIASCAERQNSSKRLHNAQTRKKARSAALLIILQTSTTVGKFGEENALSTQIAEEGACPSFLDLVDSTF